MIKCVNCDYESEKVKLTLTVDKKLIGWAKTNNINISDTLEQHLSEIKQSEEFLKQRRKYPIG